MLKNFVLEVNWATGGSALRHLLPAAEHWKFFELFVAEAKHKLATAVLEPSIFRSSRQPNENQDDEVFALGQAPSAVVTTFTLFLKAMKNDEQQWVTLLSSLVKGLAPQGILSTEASEQ